ncbi:MAG: GMC family oxidoreductase N-terminal domain-containing protein [Myxococcaceae bacterium]
MIYDLDDVRRGFDIDCDAVVVGSGPGGAVAAANLARAGMRVVVLEAGPRVRKEDMIRDAPLFLARYFWDGGLRMVGGTATSPSLQARCLGGGSVVNSAIMFRLPDWVRELWSRETGLSLFKSPEFDAAYDRVFERTHVSATPMSVMSRRNLIARDAFAAAGLDGEPLPRSVVGCDGCADCLTGCTGGRKQSMDLTYLPAAEKDGARIYTCSEVDKVLVERGRAVGVEGRVVDPRGHRKLARFKVRARHVLMAAGTVQTPVILLGSGIHANHTVGATFFAHVGGGMVGIMDEVVEPWLGATQGWGAFSKDIRGLKYESLWASPSVLMVRWGDVGERFMKHLDEVKNAVVLAFVYRANVKGKVGRFPDGSPNTSLHIPEEEARTVLRGAKVAADALLKVGARYVHTGIPGVVDEMRTPKDTESMLNPRIRAKHLQMTMNHVFGSCRMSADASGTVDENGKVKGLEGLYLCDGSIFPSPSAVNPQATIMALSDVISRRLAELH